VVVVVLSLCPSLSRFAQNACMNGDDDEWFECECECDLLDAHGQVLALVLLLLLLFSSTVLVLE
jgi:hypothetical protein